MCDVNTEGKHDVRRSTRNDSGEKKSRLTRSIVIKLQVKLASSGESKQ